MRGKRSDRGRIAPDEKVRSQCIKAQQARDERSTSGAIIGGHGKRTPLPVTMPPNCSRPRTACARRSSAGCASDAEMDAVRGLDLFAGRALGFELACVRPKVTLVEQNPRVRSDPGQEARRAQVTGSGDCAARGAGQLPVRPGVPRSAVRLRCLRPRWPRRPTRRRADLREGAPPDDDAPASAEGHLAPGAPGGFSSICCGVQLKE
jgi:hypothetical protein